MSSSFSLSSTKSKTPYNILVAGYEGRFKTKFIYTGFGCIDHRANPTKVLTPFIMSLNTSTTVRITDSPGVNRNTLRIPIHDNPHNPKYARITTLSNLVRDTNITGTLWYNDYIVVPCNLSSKYDGVIIIGDVYERDHVIEIYNISKDIPAVFVSISSGEGSFKREDNSYEMDHGVFIRENVLKILTDLVDSIEFSRREQVVPVMDDIMYDESTSDVVQKENNLSEVTSIKSENIVVPQIINSDVAINHPQISLNNDYVEYTNTASTVTVRYTLESSVIRIKNCEETSSSKIMEKNHKIKIIIKDKTMISINDTST